MSDYRWFNQPTLFVHPGERASLIKIDHAKGCVLFFKKGIDYRPICNRNTPYAASPAFKAIDKDKFYLCRWSRSLHAASPVRRCDEKDYKSWCSHSPYALPDSKTISEIKFHKHKYVGLARDTYAFIEVVEDYQMYEYFAAYSVPAKSGLHLLLFLVQLSQLQWAGCMI